jgi:hypothetical protein
MGLMSVAAEKAAIAVFGVGIYFWLLRGAVITSRLFFGSPLPLPFRPVEQVRSGKSHLDPGTPEPLDRVTAGSSASMPGQVRSFGLVAADYDRNQL